MRTLLATTVVGLGLVACSSTDETTATSTEPTEPHPAFRRARLAVADGERPELALLDVEFREVRTRLDTPSLVTGLASSSTGSIGIALTADGPSLFRSGVAIIDHTGEGFEGREHIHVYKATPDTLDFTPAEGTRLATDGERWVGFRADADASHVVGFPEAPLIQNEIPEMMEVELDAHEGLALPFGEDSVLTTAGGALARLDATGTEIDRVTGCTAPRHGVRHGDAAVLTCEEGWGTVRADAELALTITPYASGQPGQPLIEHVDADRVAAFDGTTLHWLAVGSAPEAGSAALSVPACDVVFEEEFGTSLAALAADGNLYRLTLEGAVEGAGVSVSGAFECGESIRPHLATAPRLTFVSLPSTGEVVELDASFVEQHRYEVGGRPNLVAVLGMDPRNRNAGYCTTCD